MEIIYVDSLFLLNFIIDYLLLTLTFRLCALPIKRLRCIIGAIAGGIYAVMCFLPGFGYLETAVFKLALWIILSLLAFGGEEYLLKCALSFLTISAVFGGGVWASSMLTGGSIYGVPARLDMATLIFSFAVCYAFISLTFSLKMRSQGVMSASVEIVLRGKRVKLTALHDSGNFLREQISGKRVMAVGASDIAELFSAEELEALCCPDSAKAILTLSGMPGAPGFRPVFYRALGLNNALLPAFTPDELRINGEIRRDYVIAVSSAPVGSGEYSGVI